MRLSFTYERRTSTVFTTGLFKSCTSKRISIPRLKLLSALLLARLLSTETQVIEPEMQFRNIDCHTDSQFTLFWITNRKKGWKQFVQNRVNEIREPIPTGTWSHCPGAQNPADFLSRGASSRDLQEIGSVAPWATSNRRHPQDGGYGYCT